MSISDYSQAKEWVLQAIAITDKWVLQPLNEYFGSEKLLNEYFELEGSY